MKTIFTSARRLLMAVAAMLIASTWASAENSIPCTADEFDFSAYESIDGKTEGGYNGLGSFRNNMKVVYKLNNTAQQAYTIRFAYKGGTAGTTIKFTFEDQDYNTVEASKTVSRVDDWAYTEVDIPELGYGKITMTMTFLADGYWACNMKEMSFSAQSAEKYVELPAQSFDLLRYTDNQTEQAADQRTSTALTSFKNGKYVTYLLNNTVENSYLVAFEAGTPRDDASIDVILSNKETGEAVCSQNVAIANTGDWNTTNLYLVKLPTLAVDKYVLKLVFNSSATNWTANLYNLQFKDAAALTEAADGNTIKKGSPWSTSGTIKCADKVIDSDRNGAKAVYLASNSKADAVFNLVVKAATPNQGVQLKVSALTISGDTIATKTLDVAQGSDWNTTEDYIYELGTLPEGYFFVVLDIIKNDNSWAVNIHEIAFVDVTTTAIQSMKNHDCEAVYTTLSGIRTEPAKPGLYIKTAGGKSVKVYVK